MDSKVKKGNSGHSSSVWVALYFFLLAVLVFLAISSLKSKTHEGSHGSTCNFPGEVGLKKI